jgi:hypothetical protein
VESAHTIIPLRSEKGGLVNLDSRRDELAFSAEQLSLLLRSALEAGHAVDYWFNRIQEPQQALAILTSPYLGAEAQERACHLLGLMGKKEDEAGKLAKEKLLEWACASESPRISQAASLALAPLVDEQFIRQHFSTQGEGLTRGEVSALANMYESRWLPLKALAASVRRRVYVKLLQNNLWEITAAALRAAAFGAVGFSLAAIWNYSQVYIGVDRVPAPRLDILFLQLYLIGLATFTMALPGGIFARLGRDLCTLLAGGRQKLPAALGTLIGSILGIALTVVCLATLAEYSSPSWAHSLRYFLSGVLLGAAISLPWLLSIKLTLKRLWMVLLAGLCGGLFYLGVSQLDAWWPQTSFALTLDGRYGWTTRVVTGFLIGFGSMFGLAWEGLPRRS